MNARRRGLGLLSCALLLSCQPKDPFPPSPFPQIDKPSRKIGLAYPGMADAGQRDLLQPFLEDLRVSDIRFDEDWALREAEAGTYTWQALADRLAFAREQGLRVFLTVKATAPPWACGEPANPRACVIADREAFSRFAAALARNFGADIDAVQFGNEWQTRWWYPGEATDYVDCHNRLAAAFREHSPGTRIVLGGFSIDALRNMAAMRGLHDFVLNARGRPIRGKSLRRLIASPTARDWMSRIETVLASADYDAVDAHLYADAEYWDRYVEALRGMAPGKPIFVTEFGGPDLRKESDDPGRQAQRLRLMLGRLEALPIERAYYYRLWPSATMSPAHRASWLVNREGPREAYAVLRAWNHRVDETPAR